MLKNILITVGCLVLAIAAHGAWSAYSAKRKFEAVSMEYSKTRSPPPQPAAATARRS